ncbi:DUF1329 domain-containing protein [Pseudothauera nasutitermitis]|uniref:DUF1329 domain-containing protein n=1 Tax=Pseudothauera nasutitermitis TaxID=2565930 RepID=A0A4S4ASU1_9RHOO|nr:DUF1329 domain-containing protein [Pseudothauera nasutitermitis]THF62912.1 DUF1329 domain-containing protein [Pseudothauera nasutitermitis]
MRNSLTILGAALALAFVPAAHAEVSAAQAAELGKSLTPLGAERAGNAAGTIPAWDGGLTKPPGAHTSGDHYADPFAADQPLLEITAANAAQHQDKLTPGQLALLNTYPTWKIKVYPTRRSAAFPQGHYDQTVANATKVKLADNGSSFSGTTGGIPFPIPQNGMEAIWNHLARYRGEAYAMNWSQAAVTRTGSYTPVRFEYEYDFHYGSLTKSDAEREPNKLFNFLQTVTAPARLAGQILLVHEFLDSRQAWTYNPGQRRVRLAPNVSYDNPGTAADGLRTNDDFIMFNGAIDRYDWKLVGKQEIYVPYNSYKLVGNQVKMADVLMAGHLNPEHARYELHRVWVVEATLKQGTSHIYHRRTFYIDEDSWMIVVADKYDSRGQLWRVSEQHNINFYDVPMQYPSLEVHHDLQSGRYIAMGLRNDEPRLYQQADRRSARFTPAGLRDLGTR